MKYKIQAQVTTLAAMIIEAPNEEEAEQIALDKLANDGVNICIHGSEMCDGENSNEFVLVDGGIESYKIDNIDEY